MFLNVINLFVSNNDGDYSITTAGYVALIVLLILFLASISLTSKNSKKIRTKELVFSSVAIALAMVTSFLKVMSLPFGGSITLFSMFFICLIGYLYGIKTGLIAALSYGILQLLVDPKIYFPLQAILDYPLAFGCLGFAGFFSRSKFKFGKYNLMLGYFVGVLFRYICHVISGYIFFKEYTPIGKNPIMYTLTYNASYILPELILTMVLICIPAISHGLNQVKKMAYQD